MFNIHPNFLTNKQKIFLDYLIEKDPIKNRKTFSIREISQDLGISTASVRELLEFAKFLGIIQTQPRNGIVMLPYQFNPAVIKSLYCAVKIDRKYFNQFADVRNHLERAYFKDSVVLLNQEEKEKIYSLTEDAMIKLTSKPAQIPHPEHRKFHLDIFQHFDNKFVIGFIESFWDMYEIVGLNLYKDLDYLKEVWSYHQKIAENILSSNYQAAFEYLVDHILLIDKRLG